MATFASQIGGQLGEWEWGDSKNALPWYSSRECNKCSMFNGSVDMRIMLWMASSRDTYVSLCLVSAIQCSLARQSQVTDLGKQMRNCTFVFSDKNVASSQVTMHNLHVNKEEGNTRKMNSSNKANSVYHKKMTRILLQDKVRSWTAACFNSRTWKRYSSSSKHVATASSATPSGWLPFWSNFTLVTDSYHHGCLCSVST